MSPSDWQTMRDESGISRHPKLVDADTARSRQQLIGQRLRDLYDGVLEEGVPDAFEDLLAALDGEEGTDAPAPVATTGGDHD